MSRVLLRLTSADAVAPPLPVLSVLFAVFGSNSVAVAVAALSNAPFAVMVAVTVIVALAALLIVPRLQGKAEQPPWLELTFVIVRLVGVSVTVTFVAASLPPLVTVMVY